LARRLTPVRNGGETDSHRRDKPASPARTRSVPTSRRIAQRLRHARFPRHPVVCRLTRFHRGRRVRWDPAGTTIKANDGRIDCPAGRSVGAAGGAARGRADDHRSTSERA
jgi:hypothetical protein